MDQAVTVAVDANGADLGPAEVAAAAATAAAQGTRILLFGAAKQLPPAAAGVTVVDAPVSIAKAPDPTAAVRATPEASIVQAARALADGRADALVAGGSTGAVIAAGVLLVRRARGVHRPALAAVLPLAAGPVVLLDVGASVEARPEQLLQFALMGAAFAEVILGIQRPRVALLANGAEPTKGTPTVVAAHEQLSARAYAGGLRFTGNVEGTDLAAGGTDVVVADGFTGNVALKAMEGASAAVLGAVRDTAGASARARAGGLLLRPALRELRDRLDPEQVGGAHLLGLRRVVVVPHGRFSRRGIGRAIELATRSVRQQVVQRTHAALEAADALRRPPAGQDRASPSATGTSVPTPP